MNNELTREQVITCQQVKQGATESFIRNCWRASNGNEAQFWEYLFGNIELPPPQFNQDDDAVFSTQRQMEIAKMNSLNAGGFFQPKRRDRGKMVGLMNLGNNCSLSVILQMILQYCGILKLLFGCRPGNKDCYDKFITQLKFIYAQMIMSNKDFCSPRDVLVSMCWQSDENQYIGKQLDVVEIYLDFIQKFDRAIRKLNPDQLLQTVANRQESFGCPQLNNLFSTILINNEHNAYLIAAVAQKSVLEFFSTQYNGKIKKLPQILMIQIQRVSYNAVLCKAEKIRDAFVINKELGLDFTLQIQPQSNMVVSQYSQRIAQINPNKLPEIQKQIEALDTIIKDYESDPNGLMLDQIRMLKSRKLTKERELENMQKLIRDLGTQVEQQQRNQYNKYYLHCVVVHIGSAEDGHNFVYIYNFYQQCWLEYNDTNVSVVSEDKVMNDGLNNAQLVSYVSQTYIQELKQHNQNLNDALTMVIDQPNRNYKQSNSLCSLITQPEYDLVVKENNQPILY